jgi:hypothetical protein
VALGRIRLRSLSATMPIALTIVPPFHSHELTREGCDTRPPGSAGIHKKFTSAVLSNSFHLPDRAAIPAGWSTRGQELGSGKVGLCRFQVSPRSCSARDSRQGSSRPRSDVQPGGSLCCLYPAAIPLSTQTLTTWPISTASVMTSTDRAGGASIPAVRPACLGPAAQRRHLHSSGLGIRRARQYRLALCPGSVDLLAAIADDRDAAMNRILSWRTGSSTAP